MPDAFWSSAIGNTESALALFDVWQTVSPGAILRAIVHEKALAAALSSGETPLPNAAKGPFFHSLLWHWESSDSQYISGWRIVALSGTPKVP